MNDASLVLVEYELLVLLRRLSRRRNHRDGSRVSRFNPLAVTTARAVPAAQLTSILGGPP